METNTVSAILTDLFHACGEDAGVDGFGHCHLAYLSGFVCEFEDRVFGGRIGEASDDGECGAEFEFGVTGFDDEFREFFRGCFGTGLTGLTLGAGEIAGESPGCHHTGDHYEEAAGADERPYKNLAARDHTRPVASTNKGFSVLDGHL